MRSDTLGLRKPGMRKLLIAATGVLLSLAAFLPSEAEVFYNKAAALRLAFPDAVRVETRALFLSEDQARRVTDLARAPLESRLVTVYIGQKAGGEVEGYAFLEQHLIRTKPETLMVVVDPKGKVGAVYVLAFFEPPEYLPSKRWIKQFIGRGLSSELQIGREIQGITGATLSTRAILKAVRRALAVHKIMILPEERQ
ncbi:electron transport complex subunit RsxG [bacterium BMS3Bbin07]|nr:electron transport complex subunit RsxG [bacterium BMS3Bbin07]